MYIEKLGNENNRKKLRHGSVMCKKHIQQNKEYPMKE